MTITIARARRDDAFACAALRLRSDLEEGHLNRAGFVTEYADDFLSAFDEVPTWIATRSDGTVVGIVQCALVHRMPTLARGAKPWLYVAFVFVVPDERGKGLGERMLRTVDAWADARGVERMLLNTRPKARPLYERLGLGAPEERHMHRDAPFAATKEQR